MNKTQRTSSILLLLFIAINGCGGGSDSSTKPASSMNIEETLVETLDVYLNKIIADNEPGMAISVIQHESVIYSGSKGQANTHSNTAITNDSGFRLASISKTFTALAIMKLYEQKLIHLNDPILTYLPELSSTWADITIHHLLAHQSGIPNYETHKDAQTWLDGQTNDDVLNFYQSHPALSFQPGTSSEYSNAGYHLLSEIIERVSGTNFEDFMMNNFFIPLEMNDSYVADETTISRHNDALNFAEFTTFHGKENYTNGANGIVSSINDLAVFSSALLNEEIVKKETLELMVQHHTLSMPDIGGADYGYGWILSPSGVDSFSHNGSHDGFRSLLLINRELNLKIIVLGNGGDTTGDHNMIAGLIIPFLQ